MASMESALFELDDLGILRSTKVPPHLEWMTDKQIEVLLAVLMSGEEGMSKRRTKQFDADAVRMLELRDYLVWERDRFGRLAFLCLTWKGQEAAQVFLKIAQHESRAAVQPAPETD